MNSAAATTSEIVEKLNLKPHTEGGFYSEMFKDFSVIHSRSHLLSQWSAKLTCLGPDVLLENQTVQYSLPPNVWFGSFPTKDIDVDISSNTVVVKHSPRDPEKLFSLVGCTCSPAFQFDDFELANHSELISHFPKYESLISLLTFPG